VVERGGRTRSAGSALQASPHNPNDSGTIVFQLASSKMYELSSHHHDASCRLAPLTFLARASMRAHSQAIRAGARWSGTGRSRRHYSQVPRSVRLPPVPATICRCAAVLGAAAHSAQPLGALSIRSNPQSRSLKPLSFRTLNLQTTPFSPWTCHIPKTATCDKFQIPTAIPGSAARTLAHNVGQIPNRCARTLRMANLGLSVGLLMSQRPSPHHSPPQNSRPILSTNT
jgi:hypothetical protein